LLALVLVDLKALMSLEPTAQPPSAREEVWAVAWAVKLRGAALRVAWVSTQQIAQRKLDEL